MGCRSEVFLSKNGLRKTKLDGRKYDARQKLDLMRYKRSMVCPSAISGIDDRVRLVHANGAKAYPRCLVAS